jgi:hypothetical protein
VTFDTSADDIDLESAIIPLIREEVTEELTIEFDPTGVSESGSRATATIKVVNETNTAQPLVANTRFQSENGKIYRIADRINVPALGSVTVEITAEEGGEDYNIEPGRLSIPGLSGSGNRSAQIYGELDESITNGSSENQRIVTEDDIDSIRKTLQEKLTSNIQKTISNLESSITPLLNESLEDSISIQFTDIPSVGTVADSLTVNAKATVNFYGYVESTLDELLRSSILETLDEDAQILSIPEIAVEITDQTNNGVINARVFVTYVTSTSINTESIINNLRGKPLSQANIIIEESNEIAELQIQVSPSFFPLFPFLESNIKVIIQS